MQPIAGYNYGAMQLDRVMRVLELSIIAATVIMTVGWAIAMFIPYYCVRLFTNDPTLIEMSIKGTRIDLLMFPVVGAQMVITNFFQCIGKVKISIFLSLSRQLLFLLPLLAILPPIFGLDGVWGALPASDLVAVIVAVIMMTIYMKKFKIQHKESTNGKQGQTDY